MYHFFEGYVKFQRLLQLNANFISSNNFFYSSFLPRFSGIIVSTGSFSKSYFAGKIFYDCPKTMITPLGATVKRLS